MSLHGYWQHIHPPMWILKANSLSFFCLTGFLRDTHSMKLSNCWSTEQYFSNSTKKKNPIMYDYTAFACIWVFHFVKNIIYIFRHWYPKKKNCYSFKIQIQLNISSMKLPLNFYVSHHSKYLKRNCTQRKLPQQRKFYLAVLGYIWL